MAGQAPARPPTPDGPAARTYAFGRFELDPANATLRRGTAVLPLTPKALTVLEYLVAHPGRLVTKHEFMERVWPDVFVGNAVLKVCIAEIRHALLHGSRPA